MFEPRRSWVYVGFPVGCVGRGRRQLRKVIAGSTPAGEGEGVGEVGGREEKSFFVFLPSPFSPSPPPSPSFVLSPQFSVRPTICPWFSKDARLYENKQLVSFQLVI